MPRLIHGQYSQHYLQRGRQQCGLTYSICIDVAFLLVLFDSYSLFGRYTNLPSKFEDLFLRYKLALARMPKFKLVYFNFFDIVVSLVASCNGL